MVRLLTDLNFNPVFKDQNHILNMFLDETRWQGLPVLLKTSAASAAAAAFRIGLMPVDTFKTTLQVKGFMS